MPHPIDRDNMISRIDVTLNAGDLMTVNALRAILSSLVIVSTTIHAAKPSSSRNITGFGPLGISNSHLCAAKGCRVRAPGLQQHGLMEGVGRVPSPGRH